MWAVEAAGYRLHVIPIDDLKPHDCSPKCWCRPTQDVIDPGLFTHHSMDRREEYEQGRRLS